MPGLPAKKSRYVVLFTLIVATLILFSVYGRTSENQERFDLIKIRIPGPPADYQMPQVVFPHDIHTQQPGNNSCKTCHIKEKNRFVFKFKRLKDKRFDSEKELYHKECIGCHRDKEAQGLKAGPLTGECRLCHAQKPEFTDAAQAFGMDKSLHYRHVLAETIRPAVNEKEGNCGACHHEYNKDLKKTVYVKGREGTCRYCHKREKTDEARSFKVVAHEACLNCHYELKSQDKKAGPTKCFRCHDAAARLKIAKLKKIPRMKRNQPDTLLMSAWLRDALESGKPSRQFVKPVVFNHLSHENHVDSCRACHHASMEPCEKCHTLTGSEKGKFITLEQAMHAPDSSMSCSGCHRDRMKSPDCAGCHVQMDENGFSKNRCNSCHTVAEKSLEPLPKTDDAMLKTAEAWIKKRSVPKTAIPADQVPEKVTIDIMTDKYQGAVMPHRKIVSALFKGTQKSVLAKYFHVEATSLCLGCHHHTPSTDSFPKCAACHAVSSKSAAPGRPGLKGAYHGQCMTCHQQMGIEKPAGTDCTACHKEKTKTATGAKQGIGL